MAKRLQEDEEEDEERKRGKNFSKTMFVMKADELPSKLLPEKSGTFFYKYLHADKFADNSR